MENKMENKKILIIGGSGSLGNMLTEQYVNSNKICVYSRSENTQWLMKQRFKDNSESLTYMIGSAQSHSGVEKAIFEFKPNVIIIASALKHVDVCEANVAECIDTNVVGVQNITRVVATNACKGLTPFLKVVLLVSTDKACAPANVYGMSKSISERVVLSYCQDVPSVKFLNVRYGNVLQSRGSLIPFYKQLIANGSNFLPVTDLNMTRFFMTLQESVKLIEHAILEGETGDTIVPRHIKAYRIEEIARHYCNKYDTSIKVIGIKPGEKIHEVLISETESFRTVEQGDYYVIKPSYLPLDDDSEQVKFNPIYGGDFSSNSVTKGLDDFILSRLMIEGEEPPKHIQKKKIAICLAGFIRTWKYCKSSFKEQLTRDTDKYEFHLFIHTYHQNYYEYTAGNKDEWLSIEEIKESFKEFEVKQIVVEDRTIFQKSSINIVNQKYSTSSTFNYNHPESSDPSRITIPIDARNYEHLRKLNECNKMRQKYEILNNERYDLIVKTRFDLMYFSPIDWDRCIEETAVNCICIDYGACWGWPNDVMCVARPEVMDNYYANRFDYIEEMFKDVGMICAHGSLKWILNKGGVEISRYKVTNTLCSRSKNNYHFNDTPGGFIVEDVETKYQQIISYGATEVPEVEKIKYYCLYEVYKEGVSLEDFDIRRITKFPYA